MNIAILSKKNIFTLIIFVFIFVLAIVLFNGKFESWVNPQALTVANAAGLQVTPKSDDETGENLFEPGARLNTYHNYIPLVINSTEYLPKLEIIDAWVTDVYGVPQYNFQASEQFQYWASGSNNFTETKEVSLRWIQSGPCGESLVFSDTVSLDPGEWQHIYPSATPDCSGVFTPTIQITYETITTTKSTQYTISQESVIVISDDQGFDRCARPEVYQMQSWWDNSPYRVFNLYLGGISFACKDTPLDADWVRQVAEQGWTFIQTWVGPQAPCTSYSNKISLNSSTAYNQGRNEADMANNAANELGFTGENIIYYDLEGYPDEAACRNAVKSFVRGWVDRLHELGLKAGAYGAACTSFVSDWAEIESPPDDVWIAHWYLNSYNPAASVWDARCVSNDLWAEHQRIKQYTGGHVETWGGVSLGIDSDVLDGEITAYVGAPAEKSNSLLGTVLHQKGPRIKSAGLLDSSHGWVLGAGQLFLVGNNGEYWQDITPANISVWDVIFQNRLKSWVVGSKETTGEILIAYTEDGGISWKNNPIPISLPERFEIDKAFLEVTSTDVIWVVLRQLSGSNFSVGRLFFSKDNGQTWEERNVPLGESVRFLDDLQGWAAGGPAGNLLYRTFDGGETWQQQKLDIKAGERATVGLPSFRDELNGFLPVGVTSARGSWLVVYHTEDGGQSWRVGDSLLVSPALISTNKLLSSLGSFSGYPEEDLFATVAYENLPDGAVAIDFINQLTGWIVIQEGHCEGDKGDFATEPLQCEQTWQLMATDDGGRTWYQIDLQVTPLKMDS